MWDMMVAAAQAPALHWAVVGGSVATYVYKVFTSRTTPLMGDVIGDDVEI